MRRKIHSIHQAQKVVDGAGVHINRVFGFHNARAFDPFLLLDHFESENPEDYQAGFPWHPHRGIETVTYIKRGLLKHQDSLGTTGNLTAGSVQWMTAGSGIVHQEMPQVTPEGISGFQLWLNLSSKNKMADPRYQEFSQRDEVLIEEDGMSISLIAGHYKGKEGLCKNIATQPIYHVVHFIKEGQYSLPTSVEKQFFVYVFDGKIDLESHSLQKFQGAVLTQGEELVIRGEAGAGILVLGGNAINEPIAWRGPIVMNTDEELDEAFREYRNGNFLKHK